MAKVVNYPSDYINTQKENSDTMKIPLGGGSAVDARNLSQSPGASPLRIFVLAKKKINDVFNEICLYVGETVQFLDGKTNSHMPLLQCDNSS